MTAPVSPAALPVGFVINGRYEVLGPLGSGGNGVVYRVTDHNTGQVSALKIVLTANPLTVWDEAHVLAGLEGEFVLPVRNADLVSGLPFLVTPVAEHGTLTDALGNGGTVGVPVDLAVRWTQQACRGVARVHDRGLLHNDVKPDNIFVGDRGEALVGDLGLACLRDAHGNGHCAGTPTTMAPEVAAAALAMTAGGPPTMPTSVASDVYSLGATLRWLLTGLPPHHDPLGGLQTMQAVVAAPPPDLRDTAPHIPQGLAEIVARAMYRDPARRHRTPADLDAALGARSRPTRRWTRLTPHPGHDDCYEGTGRGKDIHLCVVVTGVRAERQLQCRQSPSGRAVNPWPVVPTPRTLPRAIRARIKALS